MLARTIGFRALTAVALAVAVSGLASCGGSGGDVIAPPPDPVLDARLTPYPIDASFAAGGHAIFSSPLSADGRTQADVRDLIVAADGGVWAVGVAGPLISAGLVIKLDSGGRADPVCGQNGLRVFQAVAGLEKPVFNSIQRDGNGGVYLGGTLGFRPFVARMLTDRCEFDPSYGTNGIALFTDLGFAGTTEALMAVEKTGAAYLMASNGGFTYVRRYLPSGEPDPAYGSAGKATASVPTGFKGSALAIADDGSVFVGGQISQFLSTSPAVAKLSAAGTVDLAYGDSGFARLDAVSKGTATVNSIALLPDGRVIVGGMTADGVAIPDAISTHDSFIARLTLSGALDTQFAQSGWIRWDWGFSNSNVLSSIVVRRDGRMAACGHTYPSLLQSPALAIMHFTPDGLFSGVGASAGRALLEHVRSVECRRIVEDSMGRLLVGGPVLPTNGFIARTVR